MLNRQTAMLIAAIFVLSDQLQAIAQTQPPATQPPWPGPWHMMSGGACGWSLWWAFPVMMLICVGATAFMMQGGMMHRHRSDRPSDVLKERFARGEINQSEYEERKRFLG